MSAKQWSHLPAPDRLRRWRERAELSQQEAAVMVGIDLPRYNAFERGRERPGIDIATKIQNVTGGLVLATHWAQLDRRAKAS